MAEIVPTFVIHNMFRAQSSHEQRARSAVPHSAVEWLDGRRILPKKSIRVTYEIFSKYEDEIIKKVREGRLAVTMPDLTFIDSRPDGRLFKTFLNKKTEEEPDSEFKRQSKKLEELTKEEIFGSDPVPYPDPPGPRTEPELSPQPETDVLPVEVAPVVESTPSSEEITKELEEPNETVFEAAVPTEQDTITLDMPKKARRRKE